VWDDVIMVTSIPSGSKMPVGEHKFQFHDDMSSVASQNVADVDSSRTSCPCTKALNRFKQNSSRSDSFSFGQWSEGRFSQLLDVVGTVGRAHGGHKFLFQKWVDYEVLNDFNVVIHNCVLQGLVIRLSGESQEVLCIQKVGEFVELSKWVSKWG